MPPEVRSRKAFMQVATAKRNMNSDKRSCMFVGRLNNTVFHSTKGRGIYPHSNA
jgi:hypothetical protein